ncbi:MAG TPA: PAS domain S-box protein [Fimbriimonas sp.]
MNFRHLDDPRVSSRPMEDPIAMAAHLAAIVESSDDAIVSKDLRGIIQSWNRGAEQLFGYSQEEAVGKPMYLIIPEERHAEEEMILTKIRRGEKVDHFQTQRRRKDGSLVDVEVTVSPICDATGQIAGASKIARDITPRLSADETRARLAAIVESSDDAIVSKDLNGTITSWNRGAERLFGYLSEEIIGKSVDLLLPPDRQEEETSILARLRRGDRVDHFETIRLRKDGQPVYVSVTISPIRDGNGQVIGASNVSRDIGERKIFEATLAALNQELEQRVRERTAELEEAHHEMESFTYSIAHDIRAPLRAIVANSRIILEDHGEGLVEEAKELLGRQAIAATQLARLVDDLLTYSRIGRNGLVVSEVDLTSLAREVAATMAHTCHTIRIEPGLTARGDRGLLSLLLNNLLDNACKYSPNGGDVLVGRTDTAYFVRDQGIGFDMAYADRIFAPFERLVGNHKILGTGLGLASAKRVVEKHGGSIWASSLVDEGTTIYFTLP